METSLCLALRKVQVTLKIGVKQRDLALAQKTGDVN